MKLLHNFRETLLEILRQGTGQLFPLVKGNRRVWDQIQSLQQSEPVPTYPLLDLVVLLRHLKE